MIEYSDPEEFMEAIEKQVEKSRENEMRCCICDVVTSQRVVGFLPEGPARPFIFAVCEVCQVQDEWRNEANRILSPQAKQMQDEINRAKGDEDGNS